MRSGAGAGGIAFLVLAVAAGGSAAVGAQTAEPQAQITRQVAVTGLQAFEAQADRFETVAPDRYSLVGNVTFRAGEVLVQADRVLYDVTTHSGEAEGNVLFVQGQSRLAGDHLTFDLAAHTAELTNAAGYLDQGFLFRARRVIQLDQERLRFEDGYFTACTQPVPYWSFRVSSGLIIKDRYVHLFNLALKAGPVPVFYSPWIAFPIKPDRATGLLLPQIGTSQRLGTSLGNAFYWAINRSQDATFYFDTYSRGSRGGGIEHRIMPNSLGAGLFRGYLIDEQGSVGPARPEERWNVSFREWQNFLPGGRLTADLNLVSDKDYFLDYARDPDRGSDPSVLSRLEYVLNRGATFLNLRTERREQFFTDATVIQSRLPEAEVRMNSRRLGGSPFLFALEGSAGLLDKSAPNFPSGSWGRLDLFPTLSLPWLPAPFLDLTPTLRVRETYYTRSLDPVDPTQFGEPLAREFVQFDFRVLGPRLSRVFFDREGNGRLRSTIEPRFTYRYQTSPDSEDKALVPGFDEIDILPGDLNEIEYGVSSRLFARKLVRAADPPPTPTSTAGLTAGSQGSDAPPVEASTVFPPPTPGSAAPPTSSGPTAPGPSMTASPLPPGDVAGRTILTSPVEIASLFITQRYSLLSPLSFDTEFIDTNGDGQRDTTATVDESRFSPVSAGVRFNPSLLVSAEGRVGYDVLENAVASASVSASLHHPRRGFLNTTYFFRNALDGISADSSQIRFSGGSSIFRQKLSFAVSLNYDARLSDLQDQRYRFGYDTQCCGFAFEVLDRSFIGTDQREFRFVINLRGIGNFLDLQSSGAAQ